MRFANDVFIQINTYICRCNTQSEVFVPFCKYLDSDHEADVLNIVLFGMTAKQWREANTDLKGNIRDYATINDGGLRAKD